MLRHLLPRLWRLRAALVVIIVLLSSLLCGLWFSLRLKFDPNDTRYLLSAQAQALSAILALVFTLTIVVAQARSSYGTRSWFGSFKPWGGAFAVLESVGILAPLYLLGCDRASQIQWVPWSLALCVLCLGVIVPYFIQLSESLSAKGMLNELLPVPPHARNSKEYQAITDGLMQLTGLIANSLDRHDYVLSQAAIEHLCDGTLASLTATKGGLRDLFVDALASVASCLERDAVGVNQMAGSITHLGEAAVTLEAAGRIDSKSFARIFDELARQAVEARSLGAMVSVVNGFCYVSHLLLRQGHNDFYTEGIAEVSLAAHDGVWKQTPAIADTWCKWMWVTGAAYALNHRIPTSIKTSEDDIWKRILEELDTSHAVSRERVEVQLGEAREYLHVRTAQQDVEALDKLSAAWPHLIQPRQFVYV